ncbi:trimeric intracellular cation channel family protein [Pedobacter sp. SYSU D00535]|uniref:trimeric intracellular cation channel family protein n=1 Tax=Pedobacter sp. SYSU D00535 TaxID=2810308 RepID=UPI001A9696DA|nr:trimeric intracellular cation channel family protein [Pedobacter sp. SYSU D00535]
MSIIYLTELMGTLFFAMSGALAAAEHNEEHDWFGAGFIGFITAIGGGSLRDILLGSYPLVWIGDLMFLYVILIGIVLAGVFYNLLLKLRKTFLLFDTLGISLFTVLGTEKALRFGISAEVAAMMGMFTAVMGGVIRDTLINEIPVIFRKEIYASACLLGAAVYLLLSKLQVERDICFLIAVLVIVLVRILVVKYHISLPKFKRK